MTEPLPRKVKTIIFDLDDTLFDQEKAHKLALKELANNWEIFENTEFNRLQEAFNEADESAMHKFKEGEPIDEIRKERSSELLQILDLDTKHSEEFTTKFYDLYPSQDAPIDGAKQLVQNLSKHYQLGLITNSSKEIQMKKIDAINIEDHLEFLIFSEEVGSRKPDEEIFRSALNYINSKPKNCLYVGDSYESDVIGAKNIGMQTCWFNKENRYKTEKQLHDVEITELSQLTQLLHN